MIHQYPGTGSVKSHAHKSTSNVTANILENSDPLLLKHVESLQGPYQKKQSINAQYKKWDSFEGLSFDNDQPFRNEHDCDF